MYDSTKAETAVIIPLVIAGLCPQCNAVVNMVKCPICDSETMALAPRFGEPSQRWTPPDTEHPAGYGHGI